MAQPPATGIQKEESTYRNIPVSISSTPSEQRTICTRFKNFFVRFKSENGSNNEEMEFEIEMDNESIVHSVNSLDYDESDVYEASYLSQSPTSEPRPGLLSLSAKDYICFSQTPMFTPSQEPLPIEIDARDFEIIFGDKVKCEICST